MNKIKTWVLAGLACLLVVGMYFWWQHQSVYPSTDDAYLESNIVTMAPQIAGIVSQVLIEENQHVAKGDLLFTMDEAPLLQAFMVASAQLSIAQQNAGSTLDDVSVAQASLSAANAALANAQSQFSRTDTLFKAGNVSQLDMDQIRTSRDQALAQTQTAQANLSSAKIQAGDSTSESPSVKVAQANAKLAELNLGYTKVYAPVSGFIANISLRPGQVVGAEESLFSIVEDEEWWVDANFKETDLHRIRPNQPVTISVDMYPNLTLKGTVESIGAGSGAVFSLLPAENATGNWVKVTQRFPVRIKLIEKPTDPALQLRVGASTTAVVDTSDLVTK